MISLPRTFLLLIAAYGLVACATGVNVNLPVMPSSVERATIDGASFEPPPGGVWYVEVHSPYMIALVRPRENVDETIAVEIQLFKFPEFMTGPMSEADFVQKARQFVETDTDPTRYTQRTYEVTPETIGKDLCVRTYHLVVDHAAHVASHSGKPMMLESASLVCRHPDDPRVGVKASFSERYYLGDVDPGFKATAARMLDSVELSKLKEK